MVDIVVNNDHYKKIIDFCECQKPKKLRHLSKYFERAQRQGYGKGRGCSIHSKTTPYEV